MDQHTVSRFAENLKARGKQPATVESYSRDAQRFLDYLGRYKLPATQVEPETLVAYQDYLRSDCEERGNSVRRTVIGIRQFFRFLAESRAIKATPFDCVPIPVRDDVALKGLGPDDIESLLHVAQAGRPECKSARDAALVSLLAHEGLKANELIHLKWTDYLQERDRGSLHISGPRGRAVQLSSETNALIQSYKRAMASMRHPIITGATEKRMFIAFKGRDAASPLPVMTRHGLKFILYELGEKAGLSMLNTEQLRHFAVSYLIEQGKSPEAIMTHLGLRRLGNIAKHLQKSRIAGATAAATAPLVAPTTGVAALPELPRNGRLPSQASRT